VEDHVHHGAAENWCTGPGEDFATCPIRQGSLVRLLIGEGQPATAARAILSAAASDARHEFWPMTSSTPACLPRESPGAAKVTDACLAQLARRPRGCRAGAAIDTAKDHEREKSRRRAWSG
jgi:hypothetical protein